MTMYAQLARDAGEDVRQLLSDVGRWHDQMVLHQRDVRRIGVSHACSEECPHAEGRRLWAEACQLLGDQAQALVFLRACAAPAAEKRHC